ncbi:hypothetical protein J4E80_002576 [Alternaria sp. BMP 0032]|nr:hypothetical protein J4E80_002576 [Alternaria sp. BMP 0032]
MPNTPSQKPNHTTPANPFGPLIGTSFRSNGTLRQYYDYNPSADMPTQDDPFRIGATHATKRRNGLREGIVEERHETSEEGIASASGRSRSWDSLAECPASEDVEDTGDSEGSEGSDASSRTLGRSESSGSTVAGDEDDGKETNGGEGDSDESMEDDGDEEKSEVSSHTLGQSEDSDSGDDGDEEDSDEEMGESDDEGDAFGESYREGSRK